jgi:glyoxylase-like metal-dependent hydrolase (beta-lactamase superfamily II)
MQAKQLSIGILSLGMTLSFAALAGDEENKLIEAMTIAYGGDALVNLKTFQIDDRFISPTTGQSRDPGREEISHTRGVLKVDVKAKKAAYETWADGRGGVFQNATISDGENATNINYQANSYGSAPSADYYTFAGGPMRTTDALLVHEINKVKDETKLTGEVDYMNRPHVAITMPFPQSPELTLYVDKETHLISKMTRNNPQFGDLDYIYTDHTQNNGITYSSSINFFLGGVPNLISTRHNVIFNEVLDVKTFELPADLKQEAERIDTSETLVNKIANGVYHIGQGAGFSLFVDTGDGIIAAGGYPALQARYDRFKKEADNHKPLTYQIVTHHHADHLGGLAEAAAAGAKLVTVEENVQTIRDAINPVPGDSQFLKITNRATFGDGNKRVEIYEVATIHAASFLVTYVPAERLVFIADHMGSPYKKGTPTANLSTVTMHAALKALDLDIRKIATAHNARIFSWNDMEQSVKDYAPENCAAKRSICT